MTAIHQFVPVFEAGAVGTHVSRLRDLIRHQVGAPSEVFAPEQRSGLNALPLDAYATRARPDDVLLYHLAIGNRMVAWLLDRPERLVVDYHGVTPPELFDAWEQGTAEGCEAGLRELRQLGSRAELGIAHSEFTRRDLRHAHYPATDVAPVLFDAAVLDADPDPSTLSTLSAAKSGGGADWLFVSRVAPHKAQHDLIKALAVYRKAYDPRARLHLVGGSSADAYDEALGAFIAELGLQDAVHLTGRVPDAALAAYYASADVFVVASEHEGFGVPTLEAWQRGIPVVAYAAGAVPETVGNAGILLPDKRPATFAAAVARVLGDAALRDALARAGRQRLTELSADRADARWVELLRGLL